MFNLQAFSDVQEAHIKHDIISRFYLSYHESLSNLVLLFIVPLASFILTFRGRFFVTEFICLNSLILFSIFFTLVIMISCDIVRGKHGYYVLIHVL